MRGVTIILFSLILRGVFSQPIDNSSFYMSTEDNQVWLEKIKSLEKTRRIDAIHARFFETKTETNVNAAKTHAPLIVINGVFLSFGSDLKKSSRKKLMKLLTDESIDEITILDKQPSDWGLEKPFSGVVLIAVTSERTFRKIDRMRLR